MAVEEILITRLETVSGLSGKVCPVNAPATASAPYLVYLQRGGQGFDDLTSFAGPYQADYELNILAASYSSLKTLTSGVLTALKAMQGNTYSGTLIQAVMVDENSPELWEDQVSLYRKIINLTLIY